MQIKLFGNANSKSMNTTYNLISTCLGAEPTMLYRNVNIKRMNIVMILSFPTDRSGQTV